MKLLQNGLISINLQKMDNMKKFEYQTIIRRNYDLMSDKELNHEDNLG